MKSAKRQLPQARRLTLAETATMTEEVLERARQALHDSPFLCDPPLPGLRHCRPDSQAGTSSAAAQSPTARQARRGLPHFGMRGALSQHFEFIAIGTCVTLSATAWMVHWMA